MNLLGELSQPSPSSQIRNCFREMEVCDSSSDEDLSTDDISNNTTKAFYEIDNYKEKRMDIESNLIDYWNNKKYSHRKLAFVLHSVSVSQVSVERSFSALKLVLGDIRHNLSEENLEHIMMVKLNSDL